MTEETTTLQQVRLRQDALAAIAAGGVVTTPPYDRSGLTAGIVHVGVGGFHRAHQAMVIDELLCAGLAREFAICGVGLLEQDRRMATVMGQQDCLYTLVLKHADGHRERRVIGSMIEYLYAPDDREAVIAKMASPEVQIVSLTVTEGGYHVDPVTDAFVADAQVERDVADPENPTTVLGFVYAALRRRRELGIAPFTVLSCDNIQHNGAVARTSFTAFARLIDPSFADWMAEHVRFPDSMVDRITPVTADDDVVELSRLGVGDEWPVVAEPWWMWVLQDDFSGSRPPFGQAGVQVVDDVGPWETMKLRLANAGHQTICHFGTLLGHTYAHEAARDPDVLALLEAYLEREAVPTLQLVPGLGLDRFREALVPRFQNPEIKDTLARIRAHSSDRIPKWLLPVVHDNLRAGRDVSLAAAVCAAWARHAEAVDEQGRPIVIVDRLADELTRAAATQREDPDAFLRNPSLFGDLVDVPAFREPYVAALRSLHEHGARRTLQQLL